MVVITAEHIGFEAVRRSAFAVRLIRIIRHHSGETDGGNAQQRSANCILVAASSAREGRLQAYTEVCIAFLICARLKAFLAGHRIDIHVRIENQIDARCGDIADRSGLGAAHLSHAGAVVADGGCLRGVIAQPGVRADKEAHGEHIARHALHVHGIGRSGCRFSADAAENKQPVEALPGCGIREAGIIDRLDLFLRNRLIVSVDAQELSQRYGVEILVYQDALEVQPWDYEFTCEYQPQVLMQELEQLDTRLQNYPEGFLQRIGQQYNGLKIALVREISGAPETGSLETAQGVQFWDEEYTAYLALSTLEDTEYTLYHELYHLIDTVVLNESNGFDQWDLLNPVGFFYDFDYISNQTRNSDEYLREEKRYFIDTYSMSYPKEDRARIMEYAMTEGNEHYFACETMQNKLLTLCQGIRKAFGLRKYPESFLWEQYLKESLAYTE